MGIGPPQIYKKVNIIEGWSSSSSLSHHKGPVIPDSHL